MAEVFGEDKVPRKFRTVLLSHQTIARRVDDLDKHIWLKVKNITKSYIYHSLALDISDSSQLVIFIRNVDDNFTVEVENVIFEG